MPATINTPQYLLDQAKRRLKPTPVTLPGMGAVEKRLRDRDWDQFVLAEPPAGSDLKPVMGDAGLPVIGHLIEVFRGGPDFVLDLYRKHGPVYYSHNVALSQVMALGPDATQAVFSNRNKEFSQRAWDPVIGPFFEGGLMLLDGEEHMFHRRIAARQRVADHYQIGGELLEPGRVVAIEERDAGLRQHGAHRRIDRGIRAGDGITLSAHGGSHHGSFESV